MSDKYETIAKAITPTGDITKVLDHFRMPVRYDCADGKSYFHHLSMKRRKDVARALADQRGAILTGALSIIVNPEGGYDGIHVRLTVGERGQVVPAAPVVPVLPKPEALTRAEQDELLREKWAREFSPLVGRRIVAVRWQDPQEAMNCGFSSTPIVLQLDDGTLLYPMRDDEGNDAGALAVQNPDGSPSQLPQVAPVI